MSADALCPLRELVGLTGYRVEPAQILDQGFRGRGHCYGNRLLPAASGEKAAAIGKDRHLDGGHHRRDGRPEYERVRLGHLDQLRVAAKHQLDRRGEAWVNGASLRTGWGFHGLFQGNISPVGKAGFTMRFDWKIRLFRARPDRIPNGHFGKLRLDCDSSLR